ncbi:VOC family protein [Phenylobacterium montanum]|uniref:VOC family protein n=1 Tax=Phenylobacterium montanum TaxID=2823693 RepID=A0A975FZQ0_9CAUL|nr:VOC family protein [Caulobacter sp. S6]QUD88114.1 VOC family protein [Caulobacter sp. S6]
MSLIKIADIAHVRFTAPDLEQMAAFLGEFGLKAERATDGVLYARGAGPQPFLHATAEGEPGFAALGLRADSLTDLERLAQAEGVAMEDLDAPGGGKVVRLRDPDGRMVEVVAGQAQAAPLPLAPPQPHNSAAAHPRQRAPLRLPRGPSTVVRLGHCVLEVRDFRTSEAWYKSRFGFITSDEIQPAPGMAIGAFLRCDRGETPTDHHTLFLLQSPRAPAFNHAAFEVADQDDLMRGHDHLKLAGRTPAWGVGRHILGSQVFDYWKDPWGHELEHWTDGDLFTAADGSNIADMQTLLGVHWGPLHPMMSGAAQ